MKKQIILLALAILSINLVFGASFCLDNEDPSPVGNLTISLEGNNIILDWSEAEDEPECSGIDYYVVVKNGNYSYDSTNLTSYIDENQENGEYEYVIYAVDLGKNEGIGISDSIILEAGSSSRRGGGSPSYWECAEWGECINGTQTRTCNDIGRVQEDRIETRGCFPEFIPTGEGNETEEIITETTPPGFFAGITGGVIGALGTGGTAALVVIIIAIVGLAVVFSVKGRKRE